MREPPATHPNMFARAQAPTWGPGEGYIFFDDMFAAPITLHGLWTTFSDGGTGTNTVIDGVGGIGNVVTAAVDNDYHAIGTGAASFRFAAGKPITAEARIMLTEATTDDATLWFGFGSDTTTGGMQTEASGPLATYDGALFWKAEQTLVWNCEVSDAATQSTSTSILAFVSAQWYRLRIEFLPNDDVTGKVYFFIDDVLLKIKDVTLANFTTDMHLLLGVKAGHGAAAETLQVDWAGVWAKR